jgi:predicted transcriptional regulator of viral defense system
MAEPWHLTGPPVPPDAKVAQLAARQHGVFTVDQLVDCGFTASGVRKRAAAERLHRIHRGVYSLAPPDLLGYKGRFMAAVLAAGPGAVLSHREAAHLHNLRSTSRRRIDVTVPHGVKRTIEEVIIHRSRTLADKDVTTVEGIPCTTTARTLLDLAGVVALTQVERALNQAEILHVFDLHALEDQIERNANTPAASRLRQALCTYAPEAAPTESPLEDSFVALARAAGLPEPERQVWFNFDGEDPFRVDFVWRQERIVLEADSRRFHLTTQAFETDRRRDQLLVKAGWRVIRVTWRQLEQRPHEVVELVLALVRQAA